MAKKKKGRPKKTPVKGSKAHRRKGGWVSGYFRLRAKAHRNKPYNRNPRRTKEKIKKKGTRKQERARKRDKEIEEFKGKTKAQAKKLGKSVKTKQTTFGKPRGPPKIGKK